MGAWEMVAALMMTNPNRQSERERITCRPPSSSSAAQRESRELLAKWDRGAEAETDAEEAPAQTCHGRDGDLCSDLGMVVGPAIRCKRTSRRPSRNLGVQAMALA